MTAGYVTAGLAALVAAVACFVPALANRIFGRPVTGARSEARFGGASEPASGRSPVPAAASALVARCRPGQGGIFFGWYVIAAITAILAIFSGLAFYSFTFYITPMETDFGWSRTQTSGAAVVAMVSFAATAPVCGWWMDHHSARLGFLAGTLGAALGFLLLSRTTALWQFYALWGLVASARTFVTFMPAVIIASRWFRRRRGLALGIVTAGAPIGGFAIAPFVPTLIGRFGWAGAYYLTGLLLPLACLPLVLIFVRGRPEDLGLLPDGDAEAPSTSGVEPHHLEQTFTLREVVSMRSFWIVTAGFLLAFMGGDSFAPHESPFFESRGISQEGVARIIAATSILQLVFRLPLVVAIDRTHRLRALSALTSALSGLALLVVIYDTSLWGLGAFAVLLGAGYAIGPVIMTLLLSRYFGTAALGRITGLIEVLNFGGVFVGPIVGGAIFDATGSYSPALALYGLAFIASAVLFTMAAPPRRRPIAVAAA